MISSIHHVINTYNYHLKEGNPIKTKMINSKNNNSNNEIFGYNTTASHFITQGSSTINRGNSVTHNCEGMEANNADTVGVIVTSTNNFDSQYITIDRAPSGNNGTFRINYGSSGAAAQIAVIFYCFRY